VAATDVQKDKVKDVARELQTDGEVRPVVLDVCDEESVRLGLEDIERAFGRVDALINNAALFTQLERRPLVDIGIGEWKRVLDVNLTGPFLMTRAVVNPMRRAGGGSVVNIATVGIFHGSNRLAHYNASKAGLIGLTRTAARELGPFGIRVNAIAPGATATESVLAVSSPERLAERASQRCLARVQTPEDLVGPLLFLASEASGFITGQLINVDGGEFFN
jgi:3-oxoacyl-[acyl-carrier protein] reductase